MANLLQTNDVYQVRIFATLGVQTAINVLHYSIQEADGTDTDVTLAAAVQAAVAVPFKALLYFGAQYRGVGVQRILPTPKTVELFNTAGAGVGTGDMTDALPKQVSGLIALRTNFAGRRYRGRVYIPFPGESDNGLGGIPQAAYVTRLATLATALGVPSGISMGASTTRAQPVVWSRKFSTATFVTSSVARTAFATQRKRGDFGRANTSPI